MEIYCLVTLVKVKNRYSFYNNLVDFDTEDFIDKMDNENLIFKNDKIDMITANENTYMYENPFESQRIYLSYVGSKNMNNDFYELSFKQIIANIESLNGNGKIIEDLRELVLPISNNSDVMHQPMYVYTSLSDVSSLENVNLEKSSSNIVKLLKERNVKDFGKFVKMLELMSKDTKREIYTTYYKIDSKLYKKSTYKSNII